MPSDNEVRIAVEALQRFTVADQIRQGANAFSFRATDNFLQRQVFLKVIYYSPEVATELLQEPRVLVQATAGNPKPLNLVQVLGADLIDVAGEQYLCLQMEWIDGASLLSTIEQGGVGQSDAIRIARGILQGLVHLHARRILHRDLKPANILLDGTIPKITDFGSAAVLPENASSVSGSRHSALYVPPEGWGANAYYSALSDIYQVGMVLYELINGPLDYSLRHYLTPSVLRELRATGLDYHSLDGFEQSQRADKGIAELSSGGRLLLHGRPPKLFYSRKLSRIVNQATNPDPSKRYQSAADFIAKLNHADVPNWRQVCESEFCAGNWRGWDWSVELSAGQVIVRRGKPGTTTLRRVPNREFPSLSAAFSYVDSQ